MNAPPSVPVMIANEAQARIDELGLQEPYEQLLAHIQTTVPGLQRIDVELQPPYDLGGEEVVLIWARKGPRGPVDDPTGRQLGLWQGMTFPPEVCQRLIILVGYGVNDAG